MTLFFPVNQPNYNKTVLEKVSILDHIDIDYYITPSCLIVY